MQVLITENSASNSEDERAGLGGIGDDGNGGIGLSKHATLERKLCERYSEPKLGDCFERCGRKFRTIAKNARSAYRGLWTCQERRLSELAWLR